MTPDDVAALARKIVGALDYEVYKTWLFSRGVGEKQEHDETDEPILDQKVNLNPLEKYIYTDLGLLVKVSGTYVCTVIWVEEVQAHVLMSFDTPQWAVAYLDEMATFDTKGQPYNKEICIYCLGRAFAYEYLKEKADERQEKINYAARNN